MTHAKFNFNQLMLTLISGIRASEPLGPRKQLKRPGMIGLKDGIIDEEEFNTLQMLHLETLNELTGVNRRMEEENRSLVGKSLME